MRYLIDTNVFIRITDNYNYLVKKIGVENYEKFVEVFTKNYNKELTKEEKEKISIEISEIIIRMKESVTTENNLTLEELEIYYSSLREQGYTVTPIKKLK